MTMAEELPGKTIGQLANNGTTVSSLQTALSRAETNTKTIPNLIKTLAREAAFQEFVFPDNPGEVFKWGPSDFRKFIEAPRPAGCQTPIYLVERLCKGTDAWETFLELTRGEPGNPTGANQYTSGNCDNITVSTSQESSPPPTGTSVSYGIRRLKKKRTDLYERVKSGELSVYAASVEAGFLDKQITIPADPRKAARRLVKHFSKEQFSELVDEALDYYRGIKKDKE